MFISKLISFFAAVATPSQAATANHLNLAGSTPLSSRPVSSQLWSYSIEPVWLPDYLQSNLTANILSRVAETIGSPPDIRIGGSTSDYTYYHSSQVQNYEILPNRTVVKSLNISQGYYESFATYFPNGTSFIYCLNFADNQSHWANALAEGKAVHKALRQSLTLFELGNEVDHYVGDGYRAPGHWNTTDYIPQWRNLSEEILATSWYKQSCSKPKFQAASFADPPDAAVGQQVDEDDMGIFNLTKDGLVDPEIISTYAVHLYPQSTCDAPRRALLSLDLLSNHSVLYGNVSQYIPSVGAAERAGTQLVLGDHPTSIQLQRRELDSRHPC